SGFVFRASKADRAATLSQSFAAIAASEAHLAVPAPRGGTLAVGGPGRHINLRGVRQDLLQRMDLARPGAEVPAVGGDEVGVLGLLRRGQAAPAGAGCHPTPRFRTPAGPAPAPRRRPG